MEHIHLMELHNNNNKKKQKQTKTNKINRRRASLSMQDMQEVKKT